MKTPFIRTGFNYDTNQASQETGLACKDKSLAQQHFAEECDINTIVKRFHLTGELPQLAKLPEYQDYEGVFDFQTAMDTIRQANETFMELPADLRARFHNDPQEFLTFCSDRANRQEAAKLGILSPEALKQVQDEAAEQQALLEEGKAARTARQEAAKGGEATPPAKPPKSAPKES